MSGRRDREGRRGKNIVYAIRCSVHHPFEGNITQLVSEKGSRSTGVPKPAHAKPFARRTWQQQRVPQCPMCGVAGKTDYATPGAARERVDPAELSWWAVSACLLEVGLTPV